MQSRGGLKGHQFCRSAHAMIGWGKWGGPAQNATSKVSVQTRTAVLLPDTEAQEDSLHANKNH